MSYSKTKGVNWSRLKLIGTSPKLYHANPKKDSTAFLLGRAVHYALLEPEAGNFKVYTATKTRNSQKYRDMVDENPGMDIFTESEWENATQIASAVERDVHASRIIGNAELLETPITWTDEVTGIECKGIPDGIPLFDLKTTSNMSRFTSDAINYGYHGQIAFYHDGLVARGAEPHTPHWIVVEKQAPFDVIVFEVPSDVLSAGRELYRGYLATLQDCYESGSWPGVAGNEIVSFEMPGWAKPKVTLGGVEL